MVLSRKTHEKSGIQKGSVKAWREIRHRTWKKTEAGKRGIVQKTINNNKRGLVNNKEITRGTICQKTTKYKKYFRYRRPQNKKAEDKKDQEWFN